MKLDFHSWKSSQLPHIDIWRTKYTTKVDNAKSVGLKVLITFDEYLYKAWEANLSHPNDVGRRSDQYNLSRINDQGDYTTSSCRFITTYSNQKELQSHCDPFINHTGEDHRCAKYSNDLVIKIFTDPISDAPDLSNKYSIPIADINRIRSRTTYIRVTKDLPTPITTGNNIGGDKHWNSKLDSDTVKKIFLDPRDCNSLAKEFNQSSQNIRRIKSGDRWKSVTSKLCKV